MNMAMNSSKPSAEGGDEPDCRQPRRSGQQHHRVPRRRVHAQVLGIVIEPGADLDPGEVDDQQAAELVRAVVEPRSARKLGPGERRIAQEHRQREQVNLPHE